MSMSWRRPMQMLAVVAALAPAAKAPAREIKPPWRYEPGAIAARLRGAVSERVSSVRLVPERFRRDPAVERASATLPAPSGPSSTTLRWWSVPAAARKAARRYAAEQGKSVTRVVRVVEADGKAHFDVYAGPPPWRRGSEPESVLVSVDDVTSKASNIP